MLRTRYLHDDWEFIETRGEGKKTGFSQNVWLPAQVPGAVHEDLRRNGILPDPQTKMHEIGAQWVDQTDWSYRTTFDWSPDDAFPNRTLRFEGLDTVCTVLLNGAVIARSDDMFVPVEVDVTDLLREGENSLRVDFQSAIRVGEARRAEYFAQEGLDPENTERFDDRSFVRKAQYMYGWDWGPRLVSAGVWRPVTLVEHAARLNDVWVRPVRREGGWTVSVATEHTGPGRVVHVFEEIGDEGGTVLEGDGAIEVAEHEIIEWEPRSTPAVYRLVTLLVDEDDEPLDERVTAYGFRDVRLLRERDEHGESFEFELNGRKIWARGANWIPDHNFPALVDDTRLRDRLTKAKEMGFDMLRVWGGGLYESDAFYDLCDELGLLVWQDFPFACAYYPDDEASREVIRREAIPNIKRIRSHPSLALWCGNNENHEMFFNRWGGDRTPPRYYGEAIYHETLPAVVAEFDPDRSYIPSSPIGTPPDETRPAGGEDSADAAVEVVTDPKRRGPNADLWGDQHNWDVWHGRGDWRHYTDSKGRFSSEYGFASSPSLAVWRATLGDLDGLHARSPEVVWHDKTGKGTETFVGYSDLHYPKAADLADWVYFSQLNQRDALRHGVEHYRRAEFCRGSLIWQLNDCYPAQSWAILDSAGDFKALGYELRRLYADGLISLVRDNGRMHLFAANDGTEPYLDSLRVVARDVRTGEALREWSFEVALEPDARSLVGTLDLPGLATTETLVYVESEAGNDTWRLLQEPKNMKFPAPAPLVISTARDGYLTVRTSQPVVDLMLTEDDSPARFRDDFVTLPEAGVYELRIWSKPSSIQARSLAGRHAVRLTGSPI